MKVLIIDRSKEITQRLEELVSDENMVGSVYTINSYINATEFFVTLRPAVVLLGVSMPEIDSLKLLATITAMNGKTWVIVLFFNGSEPIRDQYKMLGAHYCLDKYEDFEKLPNIIRRIASESYTNL